MNLSSCQLKAQRITQSIDAYVDFGAESSSTPAQGLGDLTTVFFEPPAAQGWARTTVLSMMMHSFPYALITPAGKAFVDAVPVPVALRQQSPGGTASCHPQHSLDEASAIIIPSNVEVRT